MHGAAPAPDSLLSTELETLKNAYSMLERHHSSTVQQLQLVKLQLEGSMREQLLLQNELDELHLCRTELMAGLKRYERENKQLCTLSPRTRNVQLRPGNSSVAPDPIHVHCNPLLKARLRIVWWLDRKGCNMDTRQLQKILKEAIGEEDDIPRFAGTAEATPRYPAELNERCVVVWRAFDIAARSGLLGKNLALATNSFSRIWGWCTFFLHAGPMVLSPLVGSRAEVVDGCAFLVIQLLLHERLLQTFLQSPGGIAFLIECLSLVQCKPRRRGLEAVVLEALSFVELQDIRYDALVYFSATEPFIAQAALGGLWLAFTATAEDPFSTPTALLGALCLLAGCIGDGSLSDALINERAFKTVAEVIAELCKETYLHAPDAIPALQKAVISLVKLANRRRRDSVWGEVLAAGFLDTFLRVAQMKGAEDALGGLADVLVEGIARSLWLPSVLDGFHEFTSIAKLRLVNTKHCPPLLARRLERVKDFADVLEQQVKLQTVMKATQAMQVEKKMCEHCAFTGLLATRQLRRCSKCQETYYCKKQCQKADWKAHKAICAALGTSRKSAFYFGFGGFILTPPAVASRAGLDGQTRALVKRMMNYHLLNNSSAISIALRSYSERAGVDANPILVFHFDVVPYTFSVVASTEIHDAFPTGWPMGLNPAGHIRLHEGRVAIDAAIISRGETRFCWIVPRRCDESMDRRWWENGGVPAAFHW
uniref:MYND-type domain-containing protein n=1 Tax=Mycena chlorophos TaxID=658473 RepID=A0ABQ0L366_MYCCL|nr:predicted protein [Mycena chlorophos]